MPIDPALMALRERILKAVRDDPRIVSLVDYGSSSEGRADEWSDLDFALFIRDEDFDDFWANWRDWAGQCGDMLLGYVGYVGHPWAIFAAEPMPLRVDFDLFRESGVETLLTWPNSPLSVDSFLLYDSTNGLIREAAASLVGKNLHPDDPQHEFDRDCGDFWYFLLFSYCKLQRGEVWNARQVFHIVALEALLRLLRLRAGATDRWEGSQSAWNIEYQLPPETLQWLDRCVPAAGKSGVMTGLANAAELGRDVCQDLARANGWEWPLRLAECVVTLLQADVTRSETRPSSY